MTSLARAGFALAAAALPLRAQLTYPECPALAASDFQAVELFSKSGAGGVAKDADLSEPTRMDVRVVNDAQGKYQRTDVIFVERFGNVKWYDGAAKAVSLMGHIDVHAGPATGDDDNGLMGVVFDPAFEQNRWIYLWYSPKTTFSDPAMTLTSTASNAYRQLRLSRFTVTSGNKLDMASEKNLIKILANRKDQYHSGGPMTFDAYGDLWIAVGNNGPDLQPTDCDKGLNVLHPTDSIPSGEWGPSNTASMRGGFLRIHPDGSEKGYSIPAGNFGEYWADKFAAQGDANLAAQYRDPKKVLPEVYVKGERSNFSIAVHPTKRWLAWGTVNHGSVMDELNVTAHPAFTGYPYFHGNNAKTCNHDKTPDKPMNTSALNSGVAQLPPALAAARTNLVNVVIGGPIYAFDACLDSDVKFPPHFDEKWLVSGFGRSGQPWDIWAATFGGTADSMTLVNTTALKTGLFAGVPIRNFIGASYGKDGALYILNYGGDYNSASNNPGLTRVTYKGSCKVPKPANCVTALPKSPGFRDLRADPLSIRVEQAGPHTLDLYDLTGHRVWTVAGRGAHRYALAEIRSRNALPPGIYQVRLRSGAGDFSWRISLI